MTWVTCFLYQLCFCPYGSTWTTIQQHYNQVKEKKEEKSNIIYELWKLVLMQNIKTIKWQWHRPIAITAETVPCIHHQCCMNEWVLSQTYSNNDNNNWISMAPYCHNRRSIIITSFITFSYTLFSLMYSTHCIYVPLLIATCVGIGGSRQCPPGGVSLDPGARLEVGSDHVSQCRQVGRCVSHCQVSGWPGVGQEHCVPVGKESRWRLGCEAAV